MQNRPPIDDLRKGLIAAGIIIGVAYFGFDTYVKKGYLDAVDIGFLLLTALFCFGMSYWVIQRYNRKQE